VLSPSSAFISGTGTPHQPLLASSVTPRDFACPQSPNGLHDAITTHTSLQGSTQLGLVTKPVHLLVCLLPHPPCHLPPNCSSKTMPQVSKTETAPSCPIPPQALLVLQTTAPFCFHHPALSSGPVPARPWFVQHSPPSTIYRPTHPSTSICLHHVPPPTVPTKPPPRTNQGLQASRPPSSHEDLGFSLGLGLKMLTGN
jgi:hypothetical protein